MASLTSPHQNIQPSSKECYLPKQTTIDLVGGILCNLCRLTFATKQSFDSHYRSHGSTEITYTCNICYKEIVGYPSFRGHCYTNHVIKERFQCEHCLKQFSKICNLKEHVQKLHKFKCPTCRKEFPSKKERQLHQIIHNNLDQPPYNCNICKIEIESTEECKEHIEKHSKFLYSCPICNDDIKDKNKAADHLKKHFGDVLSDDKNTDFPVPSEEPSEEFRGIKCTFCSEILGDRVKFDAHFSCKHGDEDIVYMCVECGKTFEKYSVFKNHCSDHVTKKRYKCELCKKSFPRPSMLASHTVACQLAGERRGHKIFACPTCGRPFASLGRWREHLKIVHGIHEHLPCPYNGCDLTFDTPKQLILHQQSHQITNQNFCSQCRLVFSNVASCERHMDTHRIKVFFCPVCKRNAKDKKVIINHISRHFDVITHLCRICGKIFNSKKALMYHLKTHKKVKSYACTHCSKSFLKPHQLEQHVNTHTGVKPYKCPVCIKSFSNYPNWVKHVRRMHPEESIYIKNPTIDTAEADSIDKEGSTVEKAVNGRDFIESNNVLKHSTYVDNNTNNNNYRVLNTNEQTFNVNVEQYITDIHQVGAVDIKNLMNNISVADNNNESAQKINTNEQIYNVTVDKNITEVHHVLVSDNNRESVMEMNTDEQITNVDIEQNITQVHHLGNIDIKNFINNFQVANNKKESALEINANEQISNVNVERIITGAHHVGTIDIKNPIDHVTVADNNKELAVDMAIDTQFEVSIDAKKSSHENFFNIANENHSKSINIINDFDTQGSTVGNETLLLLRKTDKEGGVSEDIQHLPEADQVLSPTDEQISSNTVNSDKPHKCPICEKTFAKYSYMSKHVGRVHHIRSIDIKNLIIDQKDSADDEATAMEIILNEENKTSIDNAKGDNDEQLSHTDKPIINAKSSIQNLDDSKPHKCPICDKSFAKYPYMTKHVRKVHNKKTSDAKVPITDQKLNIVDEIYAMETGVDEENEISIGNSKDSCDQISNPETPNVDKPHKCPLCDKSFAKYPYMTKHVRKVHNKKNIDIKNSIIFQKEGVDEEMSVDRECEISINNIKDNNGSQFIKSDKLSNVDHLTNMESKPHKCPTCDKSFAKHSYMSKHVRTVHNKKSSDIKNLIGDHKDCIDDDASAVGDDENDTFTDNSKDDNDDRLSNTDHTDIGCKPYKCPLCEKTFARDRYCRKHVSRVHYKNGMSIKSPNFDPITSSVETLIGKENQLVEPQDYLNNEISNINSIVSIGNETDPIDCFNDIDDANASMDFANVRLENYIFSVQRESPMDIVPSMPDGKYLLNDNNDAVVTINKEFFKITDDNNSSISKNLIYECKENMPIGTELVNENGEALALVEKDLFNANNKESAAVNKDLYGNSEQNDNPIDILEYIADMPENNSFFVPVINQEALTGAGARVEAGSFPCDYGPEFSAPGPAAGFIDLDDHMLPHIDPLLTIAPPEPTPVSDFDYDVVEADLLALVDTYSKCPPEPAPGAPSPWAPPTWAPPSWAPSSWAQPTWAPPVISKLCEQYELPEASRVPLMNTDIF